MPEVVAAIAAVVAVVVVTAVMLRRVGHPYELEWLEGGSVEHVQRVLHGRSLYPAPSVDFVSYPYPPLYWLVSAGAASVLGVGFLPLRLVSLIASVATMGLLGAIVRRETGRFSAGVVAAGIYAASFRAGGSWFDVARVDALFLALFVAAVLAATAARSGRAAAVAGVLLGLSVLTKQTAALAALPMLMWLAIRRPRVAASMTAASVAVAGGVSVWLNAASHGWYRFAAVDELLGHPIDHGTITRFWRVDVGHRLWPTIVLVGLAAIAAARDRERVTSPDRAVVIAAALGLIAAAYASRLHSGDFANVLMPAYAAAALLGGLVAGALWRRRRLPVVAAVLVLAQLLVLGRVPGPVTPRAGDDAAGRALVAAIAAVPGDVLVASHPYYAVLAGKGSHAQAGAISDVVRSNRAGPRRRLTASVDDAIRHRHFAAIIFDGPDDHFGFPADLDRWYIQVAAPRLPHGGPTPVVDLPRRPTEWWVPRR